MLASPDAIYQAPILVVDDNQINRSMIESVLRARGFVNVLSVPSAKEAFKAMAEFRPDIILLDVIMPEMDGFEFCKILRSESDYRDLPILFQTVLTEPEMRAKAFEVGGTDFVSKPVYPDELLARVKVHLQSWLYTKRLIAQQEKIEAELEAARGLQSSILPPAREIAEVEKNCGLDIAATFEPSFDIGGDFWGMKSLFSHQTAVWLVDFSGHGVASALNAFRLQAYLHEHSSLASRPGEYLSMMNDKMLHLLQRGQFATMFYGIVDTVNHKLLYAAACSPPPILVRRSVEESLMIDSTGTPLGIAIETYPTQTVAFLPGDTLLLYSDGLVETPDSKGALLTEGDITRVIVQHKDATAAVIQRKILDLFNRHSGGVVMDDLTLCVIKRNLG